MAAYQPVDRYDEIEHEIACFCDDCDHVKECGGYEEFWGARVYHSEQTCPAEFAPEDPDCPKHEDYQWLRCELAAIEQEWEREEALPA